jgi:quinol-cytochrome oxidoreductase complex cytochrome b subunit
MKKLLTPLALIMWSVPYIILYHILGGNEAYEVSNGLIISLTVGVSIAFAHSLCPALTRFPPRLKASDALALGALIMAASVAVIFTGLWLSRIDEANAGYWRDHIVFGVARWYLALAIVFMMLTTRAINDEIPRESYVIAGRWIAAGVLVVVLFFSLGYK